MQHKIITNARQGTLGFYMPRPLTTGDFREACSLWLDEAKGATGLSDAQISGIFNHEADGKSRNDLSPYRFATDGSWGLLHAIGDDATAVVRRVANTAIQAKRLPALLAAPRWEDRNVGIVEASQPVVYHVPEMIVCRNALQHNHWRRAARSQKVARVQDLLHRGIQRQMAMLGFQADVGMPQVVQCERERAVPLLRRTAANAFVRVAVVSFILPAALHGHWAVGALINRGFGAINQSDYHA